jgi:hypothetical protein
MKKLTMFFAASLLSVSAHAGLIDFTQSSLTNIDGNNSFTGSQGGINYTAKVTTPVDGTFNYGESVSSNGCGTSSLECSVDGIGITGGTNDLESGPTNVGGEVVAEVMTITFAEKVSFSSFYFLDLYKPETVRLAFYDTASSVSPFKMVSFTGIEQLWGPSPNTGFYEGILGSLISAQKVSLLAPVDIQGDNKDNDFALAGISTVPVPAAAFLFAPALVGFMGLRRRAAKKA